MSPLIKQTPAYHYRSVRYPLLMCSLLALPGCIQDNFSDIDQYVAEIKALPKGAIPPLPEIKIVEAFIFKPEGLRDPFNAIEQEEQGIENQSTSSTTGIQPDKTRPKEELESYPLDGLRMVGTIKLKNVLWALIKATDGTIHRVKEGNYMGKNYGEIIRINEDRIELMEIVEDQQPNSWRQQQASLVLAE